MRIVQTLPAHPSEYDKKAARIDFDPLQDQSTQITLTYGQPPVSELPEAVAEEYFEVGQRPPANELTHAILAALFKPEVAQQKIEAARQTISKFHPRQRLRALTQLIETARK